MDNIVLPGNQTDQAIENIETILCELKKANIKLNTNKCKFLYTKINNLDHEVSSQGSKPLRSTVEAIFDYSRPTRVKHIRQLILRNFYRKYIKNYAQITFPLPKLLNLYAA